MQRLDESTIYVFEGFRLDTKNHRLFRFDIDEVVSLTPKVFDLLAYMVGNPGRVLSKDELLEAVWKNAFVEESNLSQSIFVLRKALGQNNKTPQFVLTVPNRGYEFIATVTKFNSDDEILNEAILSERSPHHISHAPTSIQTLASKSQPKAWMFAVPLILAIGFCSYWFYPKAKPPTIDEIKTIAILPFEDLGAEQADNYLGTSLADALTNKFGELKAVTVRPSRAVLKYAESRDDMGKIGRELQVDAILDGRIQRSGERIRVSVQLVRTSDNAAIWSGNFEDQFTNLFAVQDSISQKVVQSLALKLNDKERERFDRKQTENAAAYQDYLRGVYFRNKRINDNLPKAVANLEQAIQKDPNFALAYAELANSYLLMPEYMGTPTSESVPKAREFVTKALNLDDQLAEVHTTLAGVIGLENGDQVELERRLKRALELNPNYILALRWYGGTLRNQKRYEESLAQLNRAAELDPTSVVILNNIAQTYKEQGNYDAAIEQLNRALTLEDSALARDELARVLIKKGLYSAALVESQKAVNLSNRLHTLLVTLSEVYIKLGEHKKAMEVIRELEERYPSAASYYIAMLYAEFGDKERMFAWLERAIKEKPRGLIKLKDEPNFEPYRTEPRFQHLVRQVNDLHKV